MHDPIDIVAPSPVPAEAPPKSRKPSRFAAWRDAHTPAEREAIEAKGPAFRERVTALLVAIDRVNILSVRRGKLDAEAALIDDEFATLGTPDTDLGACEDAVRTAVAKLAEIRTLPA
jgi:hypothetical protein